MSFLQKLAQTINTFGRSILNTTIQIYQQIIGRPNPTVVPQPPIEQRKEEPDLTEEEEELDIIEQIITEVESTIIPKNQRLEITLELEDGSTRMIPISRGSKRQFLKEISQAQEFLDDSEQDITFSDPVSIIARNIKSTVGFSIKLKKNNNNSKNGGFFPYTHTINNEFVTNLLKEYSIHKEEPITNNQINPNVTYNRCLLESFRSQVTTEKFLQLENIIKTDFFPKEKLAQLATKTKLNFRLHWASEGTNFKRRYTDYGMSKSRDDDEEPQIQICCLENHFYRYDRYTGITKYYIQNYDNINPCKGAYKINKIKNNREPGFCRVKENTLDSFNLIKELLKTELLIPINIESILSHPEACKIHTSHYNQNIDPENHSTPIQHREKKHIPLERIYVLDYEAITDTPFHEPYMVSITGRGRDKLETETFGDPEHQNIDITKELFLHMYHYWNIRTQWNDPIIIFCHNVTYDIQFILNHPCFIKKEPLINNNRVVSCKCQFKWKNAFLHLEFKDSYRLIPHAASKLPKMLGIPNIQKEVMYYELYNSETIKHIEEVPPTIIDEHILKYRHNALDKEEAQQKEKEFRKMIQKYKNDDGTYNLYDYAKYYCEQDVKIVYQALIKFNQLFKQLEPSLPNVWNFYSLPSLAQNFFYIKGCFNECYNFTGLLGDFFNQCIIGGRCMLRNNQPQNIKDQIQDFDAVSLYPSAMNLFDGFIKGIPKQIDPQTFNRSKVDYYFVKAKIIKVGKHRHFPLLSTIDQNGSRHWTNDLINRDVYIDKVTLEDAEQFQEMEFEIIEGYYFNQGFNKRINTVINEIFQMRKKAKAEGNESLQQILKLLMNSTYGKLIQKPSDTNTRVFTGRDEVEKYVDKKYHYIKSVDSIGRDHHDESTEYLVKEYSPIVTNLSAPHLGCQILSYSKRIMNQVICLAEDEDIDIFYQDTDSLHMRNNDVQKLSNAFKNKYHKELIGKEFGQFHCDFDLEGLDPKTTISTHFIGFEKKCYLDICQDATGKIAHHIRMKGVPTNSIKHYAQKNNMTLEQLYNSHYQGQKHRYDLLVDNKPSFQKQSNLKHHNREEFTRLI